MRIIFQVYVNEEGNWESGTDITDNDELLELAAMLRTVAEAYEDFVD